MNFRRNVLAFLIAAVAVAGFSGARADLGEDGLHKQEWFYDSALNLAEDLQTAAAQSKGLIILYEQRGCIYCAELHAVNFARAEITDLIMQNYLVVQLDLNGARQVVDFDGEVLPESELAEKWGVIFTPTTLVFSGANPQVRTWEEAQVFRLPGYLKPFYYFSTLDYFASGAIETQGFSDFLRTRVAVLETQGLDPELW